MAGASWRARGLWARAAGGVSTAKRAVGAGNARFVRRNARFVGGELRFARGSSLACDDPQMVPVIAAIRRTNRRLRASNLSPRARFS